jgi:hypothetical protein
MIPVNSFTEHVSNNIIVWRNSFIKTGLTLAVMGFAVAFFSQSTFGMAGCGLAIFSGVLGALNQRDLRDVNKFEKDLRDGITGVKECTHEVTGLNKKIADLKKSVNKIDRIVKVIVPRLLNQSYRSNASYPAIKAQNPTLAEKIKQADQLLARKTALEERIQSRNAPEAPNIWTACRDYLR